MGMINRVSVLAVFLSLVLGGEVYGQAGGGSYTLGNGSTVTWSFSSQGAGCSGRVVLLRPGYIEVIEGPEGELEPIEEEGEPGEGEAVVYRVIEVARGLMAGKMDDIVIPVEALDVGLKLNTRRRVVEAAIGAYGMHMGEHPEDWMALREMGVALIEANQVEEGVGLMHEAYLRNPELGIMPIGEGLLGESKERMRKLVVRVVKYSHRESSATGWLAVSVFMQSQGRTELAGEMLGRAEELGLDEGISKGLRAALP